MMKRIYKLALISSLCLCLSGCVKLALKFSPAFIPNLSQAFFEECDTDLAKDSLPAGLKFMEGLLKSSPDNKQILTALCTGFTGYALLYVEDVDPNKASALYVRARDYGIRALGQNHSTSEGSAPQIEVDSIGKGDFEALFWTTMAWNAWINLNLDKPLAFGQMPVVTACLKKLLKINQDYYYGSPNILMGTMLAAMPGPLSGEKKDAKEFFEKALQTSNRNFLLTQYYYARYYAVGVQDKDLFYELIQEIDLASLDELKDVCLINAIVKEKAKRLLEISEDLFL